MPSPTPSPNNPPDNDSLDVQSVSVAYGQTVQLTAAIVHTSPEQKKAKQPHPEITFAVDGKIVGSALPGEGVAFAPPDSMPAGNHTITATFNDLTGSGLLTLTKAKTVLSLKGLGPDPNVTGIVGTIYLNRATDKAPLDGRAVKLFINGVFIASLTTVQGVVQFDSNTVPNGKMADALESNVTKVVPVEIKFDGDNLYGATHVTTDCDFPIIGVYTVVAANPTSVTAHIGDTVTIQVTTRTAHLKPLPNVNLDCRILRDLGTYEVKNFTTDAHGEAKLTFVVASSWAPIGKYQLWIQQGSGLAHVYQSNSNNQMATINFTVLPSDH